MSAILRSAWTGLVVLLQVVALTAVVAPAVGSAGPALPDSPDLTFQRIASPTVACASSSLCPAWVVNAYNLTKAVNGSTTNGTGQTVVLVDACGDPTIRTDLTTFDSTFGLPNATLKITHLGAGVNCHKPLWALETALDVEWAHALAPGATIHLVLTKSGNNSVMFSAWSYAISHKLGKQISDSWGGPGGCNATLLGYLSNASARHMTVLAAAGDSGAWGAGTGVTGFRPADCPGVLTVGGTSLYVGRAGHYGSEYAWSYGGGGYAARYPEPTYQSKANIHDPYSSLGKPDVAAVADPSTGVLVYDASLGGWGSVGGTSVACPIWAGFLADINSLRTSKGFPALGDFHDYLYGSVYGVNGTSSNYSKTMHDVRLGSNGWSAAKGWDAATGVGSMDGAPFLAQLGSDPNA